MSETTIQERPILFSGPMVRAILEGRKTQTRRMIKPQPSLTPEMDTDAGIAKFYDVDECIGSIRCPYGVPGDRLWVKEACWIWGRWRQEGMTGSGRPKWRFQSVGRLVVYAKPAVTAKRDGREGWVYRHARFMPRWASRILLEVTDVRVQRVQEISEADAVAEGIAGSDVIIGFHCDFGYHAEVHETRYFSGIEPDDSEGYESASESFEHLWNCIHGADAWERNDWLWAVSFKVLEVR